jgi:predicted  nucleic acid-binding Zn-ribbon protein
MSRASALYRLQSLDLGTEAKRARLAEVNTALGADQAVKEAQATVDRARAELTPWETRVTDLELEIKSLNSKAQSTDKRLYSGRVTSPKELQDMQDELASLKRRHARLEDQLLEAMIEVEERRADRERAEANREQVKASWAAEQGDLGHEKRELEAALKELAACRATAWAALDADSQSVYNTLRPKMRGQPVALLKDGSCSRCGMAQTTAVVQQVRRGDGLTRCSACGRILVTSE